MKYISTALIVCALFSGCADGRLEYTLDSSESALLGRRGEYRRLIAKDIIEQAPNVGEDEIRLIDASLYKNEILYVSWIDYSQPTSVYKIIFNGEVERKEIFIDSLYMEHNKERSRARVDFQYPVNLADTAPDLLSYLLESKSDVEVTVENRDGVVSNSVVLRNKQARKRG